MQTNRIAEIAASLSEAQAKLLRDCPANCAPSYRPAAILIEKGLAIGKEGKFGGYRLEPTYLGEAVRQHLKEQEDG